MNLLKEIMVATYEVHAETHEFINPFLGRIRFMTSIMHDIGVTERHADEPGSFEYVGAKAALEFCTHRHYEPSKAALVHDAIALHTAVGIAHQYEPETALVHFGAGVDVIGIRLDEIPDYALAETLERYPRLNFKSEFGDLLLKLRKIGL